MLPIVQFDHQSSWRTVEIDNKLSNRLLAPEANTESLAPKPLPKPALGFS
jgi:hypothetical protein